MKQVWQVPAFRWLIVCTVLVVIATGGYYGARKIAWPAYKGWREARLNERAEEMFAAKDYDNALITVRRNLRDNQRNLRMWKLGAEISKARQSPDVVFYQERVANMEKTLPNRLELMRAALEHGFYRHALDAVATVGEEARDSAEFHQLAAQLYLRVGRPLPARNHLYSLVELQPDNFTARLDLAELELRDDRARTDRAVRQRIADLVQEPALRSRALALLLSDAIAGGSADEARKWSGQLAQVPDLSPSQRVLLLEGFALGASERVEAYRDELEKDFAGDSAGAAELVNYYTRSGQASVALAWFDQLPANTRDEVVVRRAFAEAFLALRDWSRLERVITASQWGRQEFMRQALLAYLARTRGRTADAAGAWKLATIQAGDNVRSTVELLERVNAWGWQNEKYDLIWKLFALMPRNEAVRQQLIAWERFHGKTANLNRLFARISELDPQDKVARNNFAYTSLLLDSNTANAYRIARQLHQEEPRNPYFATTQALALYKQGKPAEALALFESLGAAALVQPDRLLHHVIFLAAAGDARRAADLAANVKPAQFLPEERKLLSHAAAQIARLDRTKGLDSRLVALRDSGEFDSERSWLTLLPEAEQAAATKEMERANTLYAAGELRHLGEQLRGARWGQHEHIRLALLAYVERSSGTENSARSYWRSALGAAGRDPQRLSTLHQLVARWQWESERMESMGRLFERRPTDRAMLAELLEYQRNGGNTSDLVRVLEIYVSANPTDHAAARDFAYYSMLSNLHLSRAYVAARRAYEAEPTLVSSQLVYAFSLWKQKRPEEAWQLIEDVLSGGDSIVPLPLLRSVVLADLGRQPDALQVLNGYEAVNPLPEEATLAAALRRRLAEGPRISGL